MANEITFESINEGIEKADLKEYQEGGKYFRKSGLHAESPGAVLTNVCGIYKIIRSILVGITLMPFIPAKWK